VAIAGRYLALVGNRLFDVYQWSDGGLVVAGHYQQNDTGNYGVASFAVAADLNGDGLPDLITCNWGAIDFFLAQDGGFGTPSFVDFNIQNGRFLATGDLDGDGRVDVVATGGYGFEIYRNTCGD